MRPELSRRRLLGGITGSIMSTLAGCENLQTDSPDETVDMTDAQRQSPTLESQSGDPYTPMEILLAE